MLIDIRKQLINRGFFFLFAAAATTCHGRQSIFGGRSVASWRHHVDCERDEARDDDTNQNDDNVSTHN